MSLKGCKLDREWEIDSRYGLLNCNENQTELPLGNGRVFRVLLMREAFGR